MRCSVSLSMLASLAVATAAAQTGAYPPAATNAEATAGRAIVAGAFSPPPGSQVQPQAAACLNCHGADGAGDAAAGFPRLTGQSFFYLFKSMQDYASGIRDNAIMSPIARALTETQRRDVAAYSQSLPNAAWSGRPDTPVRQLQRGATLAALGDAAIAVQGCSNCHGPAGAGLPPVYPWLGGQHAAYLEAQLQAWKSGARGGDAMAVMSNIAQRLSDADITAVSAYYASLRTQPIESSSASPSTQPSRR